MIIIISLIGLCLVLLGIYMKKKYIEEDLVVITITLGMITVIGCIISCIGLAYEISREKTLTETIEMYEYENMNIESSLDLLVYDYLYLESALLQQYASASNTMVLISTIPELKSDTLVLEQMNTYKENNNILKELKKEKLEIITYKWWLYFGE